MDSVNQNRIKISVSFWAVAVFGAAICVDKAAVLILLCAAVHELGHLFACLILNVNIEEFNLTLMGFGLTKSPTVSSRDIAVTAAGPLAGLIFAGTAYIAGYRQAGAIALILTAVNLIPIPPLDGDRILREILPPAVLLTINIISMVSLFGLGLFYAIKYISFTLVLFSLMMTCCFFGKYSENISPKMFRNSHRNF